MTIEDRHFLALAQDQRLMAWDIWNAAHRGKRSGASPLGVQVQHPNLQSEKAPGTLPNVQQPFRGTKGVRGGNKPIQGVRTKFDAYHDDVTFHDPVHGAHVPNPQPGNRYIMHDHREGTPSLVHYHGTADYAGLPKSHRVHVVQDSPPVIPKGYDKHVKNTPQYSAWKKRR